VLTTCLVWLAYFAGGLDWLERKTLDLRLRYANDTPQSDRITCIDIDDGSLATTGLRWPWPRDVQAGLIAVLGELDAAAILIDLTWVEPQPLRSVIAGDPDIDLPPEELARTAPEPVFPDLELRAALRAAGTGYVALHFDPAAWEQSPAFAAALAAGRKASANGRDLDAVAEAPAGGPLFSGDAVRLALALEYDITRDARELAALLDLELADVEPLLPSLRHFVLCERTQWWLSDDPRRAQLPPNEIARAVYATLTTQSFDDETQLRAELASAVRWVLSVAATLRHIERPIAVVPPVVETAPAVVPLYFRLARAASGVGFVNFTPDPDGVMRRQSLLVRIGKRQLPQLAFAVANDWLDYSRTSFIQSDALLLRWSDSDPPAVTIPLDEAGRLIVPWVPQRDWTRQFTRIPADTLWQVADRRRMIVRNHKAARQARRAVFTQVECPQQQDYLSTMAALEDAEYALLQARLADAPADVARAKQTVETLTADIARLEAEIRNVLDGRNATLATQSAGANELERDRLGLFYETLDRADEYNAANDQLEREVEAILERLRPLIEGRLCVLGLTATSLADTTPTPLHPRMPGVAVQANILNALVQGLGVMPASPLVNATAIGSLGLLATWLSARRRPMAAALGTLVLAAAHTGLAGLAFRYSLYWMMLAPALIAAAAAFVVVTTYRYAFAERAQRALAKALQQYTSPALARRIAEDPVACRRAETRDVSIIFTDLRDFTGLAERIGPAATQRVLNACFERFSAVLLRHAALLSKFVGDGVFAFWNAPILPQADHAARACAAALELCEALAALRAERARAGDEVFAALALRIGLATGPVVVGPCGSEGKFDYTCIGDAVNVAARLEAANKLLDTRVLVNDDLRAAAGDGFAFRALGPVRIRGRTGLVVAFELVGRAAELSAADQAYFARFAAAAEACSAGRRPEAQSIWAELRAARPDDSVVARVLALHAEGARAASDWDGALDLRRT